VDATIALPLIAHGLVAGGVKRSNPRDFKWLFSGVEGGGG